MLVFGDDRTNYGPEFPQVNYGGVNLQPGMFKGSVIQPGAFPLNGASGMGGISLSTPMLLGGAVAAYFAWKYRHKFGF